MEDQYAVSSPNARNSERNIRNNEIKTTIAKTERDTLSNKNK
jgi:hypothetical protein